MASRDGSVGSEMTPIGVDAMPPAVDEDDSSAPPRPKRQRRQVYVDVPPRCPPSKRPAVRSPRSNRGRKPQKSPSTTTTVRAPRAGDLKVLSVEEDSKVDRKMIPKWKGEVRNIIA